MSRASRFALYVLLTMGLTRAAGRARAAEPSFDVGPTIAVDQIKDGMVGYGLTVFSGTKPERFPVRVVAVLHNFLPKQDIILIQSEDPRLVHSGIAQGMSGSPIYFEDRLAGALAYGWGFAKDALAGVTPIASMTKELERKQRATAAGEPAGTTSSTPIAAAATQEGFHPAAVPLQVSGLTPEAVAELGAALAPYHLVPQRAGGGGRAPKANAKRLTRFEPGSSIAVDLIRGDISAVATGTVTAIAGDRVLAFGHPMFNSGQVSLPISTSVVHTFMSSLNTSFKLSSPLDEAGALLQDRQSGIIGDMKQHVPMIPMSVTVHLAGRPDQRFEVQIARHRFLTSVLASTVLSSSASAAASDMAEAQITLKTKLAVHNERTVEIIDRFYAPDGAQSHTLALASGPRAIGDILFNPFGPATVDRIDVDLDVAYRTDVAEVLEASLGAETVEPGSRPSLRVTLRPYGKPEEHVTIPIDIPESLAGQTVKLTVQSGTLARPDLAPPESLRGLLDNLGRSYSPSSLVVALETPDEGLTLHGKLVPELPGSVLDSLRPSTAARRSDSLKRVERIVYPTSFITIGKQELMLRVRDRR